MMLRAKFHVHGPTSVTLAFIALIVALAAQVFAQPSSLPRKDFWVPDGEVNAIVETNGIVYIGGLFDYVGRVSETGTAVDLVAGASDLNFPKFKGAIKAVVTDGAGGWIVGGLFTAAGSFPVTNLAHIRADRTVDTNWTPNPNRAVLSLAVSPSTLYVGGKFTTIGGQTRICLAALDIHSGQVLPTWTANLTSIGGPSANALLLSGNTLYVAGYFSSIRSVTREHLAAVDATTSQVTPWYPNGFTGSQAGSRIDAIALFEKTLYVGGTFTQIGNQVSNGVPRNYIAALDTTKNLLQSVLPWDPNANGAIKSIAVSCDTVYVGGAFTQIGGSNRNHIAAIDMATGQAKSWNPNANDDVRTVLLSGRNVYAGGNFNQIGGLAREFLAALDVDSGQSTLWNPRADTGVAAMAIVQGTFFAGGALGPGGEVRKNVAALDVRTGKPLNWRPQLSGSTLINNAPDESVYALAVSGNTLYIGGGFTNINGFTRNRVGAVDRFTGTTLAGWNASADNLVKALAVGNAVIYAGGSFRAVSGAVRSNLVALSAVNGQPTAWTANTDARVLALAFHTNRLFVGGGFRSIKGVVRRYLAAVDTNGVVTPWNPSPDSQVSAISLLGNNVYFGGQFGVVGVQNFSRLAAADINSGIVGCWRPEAQAAGSPGVNAVVGFSNVVYVGGRFSTNGMQWRNNLASLSTNCPGLANSWNPNVDDSVKSLGVSRNAVFAGGAFQQAAGEYHPHFAVYAPQGAPRIVSEPQSLRVPAGANIVLSGNATGQTPLRFQWQHNGTNIVNATNPAVAIANVQPSHAGEYILIVTNTIGLVHSSPAVLTVVQPVQIVTHPQSEVTYPNEDVTLSVVAIGSPSPTYQWRLNGVNIPGAIYSTLTLRQVQPRDGGSYSVVVANLGGALSSDTAILEVTGPSLPLRDSFVERVTVTNDVFVGGGSNRGLTRETNEPQHAGKVGGRSAWLSWRAPATGIATFSTRGSSFDTLLAVYTGTNISNLERVVSDEDRAGFATSEVSFNIEPGVYYHIAIDGLVGASGNILLSWSLDTDATPFPRIILQPTSVTVTNGARVEFEVDALTTADRPGPLSHNALRWQWFHGCRLLTDETNRFLTISNVSLLNVGGYRCVIRNASTHVAESAEALLEIGPVIDIVSQDKLEDIIAAISNPPSFAPAAKAGFSGSAIVINLAMGSITSPQLFDNTGSSTSAGESNHCAVLGGASKWFAVQPEGNGTVLIDTTGSAIDTVLSVYTGEDNFSLVEVACDDNGAPDGIRSFVRFDALDNTDYWVAVDGVNGSEGAIQLNWRLGRAPIIVPKPRPRTPYLGRTLELCVEVSNAIPPPTIQWFFNGSPIANATNLTLTINNVQATNAGLYYVVIQNFVETVTNSFGFIDVALPISVTATLITSNGATYLRVSVPPAKKYMIEGASNLFTPWFPLYTNAADTAVAIQIHDATPATNTLRYYRVVPWP
jgi:hypothetical protein